MKRVITNTILASKGHDLLKAFCSDIYHAMHSGDMYEIDDYISYSDSDECATNFLWSVQRMISELGYPADDMKGNISRTFYSESDVELDATLSFIFYEADVPKKKFKEVAANIEKMLSNEFRLDNVECYRYNKSSYATNGYDVEIKIRTSIDL